MTAARSYHHLGGDTPLLGATIPAHFAEIVARFGEREAVVSRHQDRRLTYSDLSALTDRVAKGLIAAGFGKGDRIGVWATDNIEWLALQMGTARIGAVLVNVNPAYRPRELAYALERSQVQGVFTIPAFKTSNYVEMLAELVPSLKTGTVEAADLTALRYVAIYDPMNPDKTDAPYPGFAVWQDFLATGFPKAVVLTHHNILNNAYFAARIMGFTEEDRLCVPVPFYHCFGMVLSNLLCAAVGACLVIPAEHFDPEAVLEAIHAERCTALHGVPTMFIAELEHPRFREFDLGSMRTGIMAGAPCPPELMRRVMTDLHCPEILIGYGQTEASPLTHLTRRDDSVERRTETVGTNLPHQEVKVVNPEIGATLPVDEIGEVCFRGYHVMRGYYGDAEATNKAIDEQGWLHSGDLGAMDEDGYVRITGRLKDMIIRGGENIYPAEIEAFLFTHPKIAQVAVFGVPDPRLGEEVAAWVQLHEGETMSDDELRDFCKGEMAHYKVPKLIRFVDEFPMTVTGKLQKFRMREMMAEEQSAA